MLSAEDRSGLSGQGPQLLARIKTFDANIPCQVPYDFKAERLPDVVRRLLLPCLNDAS